VRAWPLDQSARLCNYFILPSAQWHIVDTEMIADGLAVDDRSKGAAKVAHMIVLVALLDNEVIAR
jgi:hypothetical protein